MGDSRMRGSGGWGCWGWHQRGPSTRGRARQTVPGGASAVVKHEGPVGVAPATRPPVNARQAARPIRERHWAGGGGGSNSEPKDKGLRSDRRPLPVAGLSGTFLRLRRK